MLCALSLLLVAFAHTPLSVDQTGSGYANAELSTFVLPDGTLPALCLNGDDEGHHVVANHCEACRIVSAVDLPSPAEGYVLTRWLVAAEMAVPGDIVLVHQAIKPGASPRGPPAFTA